MRQSKPHAPRAERGTRSVPASFVTVALVLPALFLTAPRVQANPRPSTVPPTLEIAVLDPNADPLGNPAIRTFPDMYGGMQIDVPPVVLVHRYYYTGDRSFQGPLLPGGPSIVVVNHPKHGERLYIPVQMLPGAPRVIYRHHSIEYDYGKRGITIKFCWLSGRPKVEYRNCAHLTYHLHNADQKAKEIMKNLAARTGLTEATKSAKELTKNVVVTTADRTGELGRMVVTPFVQAVQMVPGVNMLISPPEDRARRLRDAQLRVAEDAAARKDRFISGNR